MRCRRVDAGADVTIVSSDKDLMQLVQPGIRMYDTMKNKVIGEAEVIEKFGVPPAKVIDVQALIGDSTDNVPGVPGIGVKTAALLITEFGDLETLLARAREIKQHKRRESLITFADQARLSRDLVILDCNVPLDVALAETAVRQPRRRGADRLHAASWNSPRCCAAWPTGSAPSCREGCRRSTDAAAAEEGGLRPSVAAYRRAGTVAPAHGKAESRLARAARRRARGRLEAHAVRPLKYETVTDASRLDDLLDARALPGHLAFARS